MRARINEIANMHDTIIGQINDEKAKEITTIREYNRQCIGPIDREMHMRICEGSSNVFCASLK